MLEQVGWYSKALLAEDSAHHSFFGVYPHAYEDLSAKQRAVFRLWCGAVSQVKITHPHPRVHVFHHVAPGYNCTQIRQACWNLPNNDNHDKVAGGDGSRWVGASFGMRSTVRDWPGYEPARLYLLAQWGVLQMHEAFENVWQLKEYVGGGAYQERVVCPHYAPYELRGFQQDMLDAVDSGNMQRAISTVLGPERTCIILERNRAQAERELKNEIAADSFD